MAEFGFTKEQEMLRDEVRRFAQRELLPGVRERRKLSNEEYHKAMWPIRKKTIGLGWTRLNIPAKYGGQPIDFVSIGIMGEEIARVEIGAGIGAVNTMIALDLNLMSEEVQDEWYPGFIDFTHCHAHAWTEAEAGSDVANTKTRAVRDGDDYVITGEKVSISSSTRANVASVSTKTDPAAGYRGMTSFWVPLNLPGVTVTPLPQMGRKRDGQGIITFDEVRVPARYRIGKEGTGIHQVLGQLDWARGTVALNNLATAQTSLEETIAWTKERITFGRPLAAYQGVSFQIAEHYTLIQAARLLAYRTLWLRDQGLPHIKEAAMCKWFCHEVAMRAIHDCIIIFGNVGYSQECPLEERLRDIIGHEIGGGTPHIMKLTIARELLGREARG